MKRRRRTVQHSLRRDKRGMTALIVLFRALPCSAVLSLIREIIKWLKSSPPLKRLLLQLIFMSHIISPSDCRDGKSD